MVKLRGPQIMDNVRSVRGAGPESELYTYAQKLLKVSISSYILRVNLLILNTILFIWIKFSGFYA